MRLALLTCVVLALCVCSGAALADKVKSDEAVWHWQIDDPRAEYPEQEPNDTCPGQSTACDDVVNPSFLTAGEQDWFTFYVTAGSTLTLGTDVVNVGDNTDTYIELYFECGGVILAQDDDGGPGFYSLISNYTAQNTGNYNLKVRGFGAGSTGPYKVFFQCVVLPTGACCFIDGHCEVQNQANCGTLGGTYQGDGTVCVPNDCPQPPPPPENDTCAGALPIDRCTVGSLQGDTYWANNDYDPGSGGCASGYAEAGKDVVYLLNLQASDIVDLTYTQLNADTAFYIITDCGNPAGSCVVGADDTFTGEAEVIYYVAPSAGAYYLILDSYGSGSGGPWVLDYNIQCPGAAEGACCYADGTCEITTRDRCDAAGGNYLGDDSVCADCPPVATETTTWGSIKANYK
jgi:hypothetical protein